MAISYTYDQSENIVLVKAIGVISIQDMFKHAEKVAGDPNINTEFIEVVDLSECTDLQVSYDSSTKLTNSWDKWKNKFHKGSIMYAPTDVSYGVIRMMKTQIEMEPGSEAVAHLVTRTKDEIPELIRTIRS